MILLEGINDINAASPDSAGEVADRLIAAYKQIIERVHTHGLEVYGGTLTPAGRTGAYEQARQAVNNWIRTSGAYDGVIDFDATVRDPRDPARLRPAYDGGEGLHLSSAGYAAMANAVDLKLLQPREDRRAATHYRPAKPRGRATGRPAAHPRGSR